MVHHLLLQPAKTGEAEDPAEKIVDVGQEDTPISAWSSGRGSLSISGVLQMD
jgi:hypothetical protein